MAGAWATGAWAPGAWFGTAWFTGGISPTVGGHGSAQDGDDYDEPRRVYIDGKPYTVRNKAEYLYWVAQARKSAHTPDKQAPEAIPAPIEVAQPVIERIQADALESLRNVQAMAAAARMAKPEPVIDNEIPTEILMLMAYED